MPPAYPVVLEAHDPKWAAAARREGERVRDALGDNLLFVHHIGSTSIPGIVAKPVLDLIPVVRSLTVLDTQRARLEALGYAWWGEFGLPGRRYCILEDAAGKRLAQLHCYEEGNVEITRHVAFRDYLLSHPHLAAAYEAVKRRCAELHPGNSHDYTDCKGDWIKRIEADALASSS